MKKFIATLIAIVMALSLVACGKTAAPEQKKEDQPKAQAIELYTKADKNGIVTVVDKDGKVVDGYTVDEKGNVLDKDGKIAVAADKVVAYVAPAKTEDKTTKAEDKKTDKAEQSTEQKTDSKPADTSSSSGSSSTSSGSSNTTKTSQPSKPADPQPTKPSQPSKPTHTHSFSSKTVAPTCSADGYTTHTCSCGDSYTDNYRSALGHAWEAQYKNVTVDDYETKCVTRCVTCGADMSNYSEDELNAHCDAHLLAGESDQYRTTYEQVRIGSHTEQELTGYTCTRCGASK